MAKRKTPASAPKSKAVSAASGEVVYPLTITLLGVKPPIWRRFLVKDCTLGELHVVIQEVMGWQDGHLHSFHIGSREFGIPDTDWGSEEEDENEFTWLEVLGRTKKFRYLYDFGDSWDHAIEVGKKQVAEAGVTFPRCEDGKRACPPEDCGGTWGYEHFKEVMANPKHKEHAELKEWFGGAFDPEGFDLADVNERLAALSGPRSRRRG